MTFFRTLLSLRLRALAARTARVLDRRALMWALPIALVGIALPSLMALLAVPLAAPVLRERFFLSQLGALLLTHFVCVLWAAVNRRLLRDDAFLPFTRTLPIAPPFHRLADIALLVLITLPWLLLLWGAAFFALTQQVPRADVVAFYLYFLNLNLLLVAAQLAMIAWRWRQLLVIIFLDVALLSLLAELSQPWREAGLIVFALGLLWWVFQPTVPNPRALTPIARTVNKVTPSGCTWVSPVLMLSVRILARAHLHDLLGRVVGFAVIASAAFGLMVLWEFDSRTPPASAIVLTFMALNLSELYRSLHSTHVRSEAYTRALPLARWWWKGFDTLVVMLVGAGLAAVFLSAVVLHNGINARGVAVVAGGYFLLLFLLRLPHVYAERHAVVISALIAAFVLTITLIAL